MVDDLRRNCSTFLCKCLPVFLPPTALKPGAVLGPNDVTEAMTWPGIIGLGEMMDFPVCTKAMTKVRRNERRYWQMPR